MSNATILKRLILALLLCIAAVVLGALQWFAWGDFAAAFGSAGGLAFCAYLASPDSSDLDRFMHELGRHSGRIQRK